jgi:hypothetical protein
MFRNCYPVIYKNSITGKEDVSIVKRPGSEVAVTTVYDRPSFGFCIYHATAGATLATSWRNSAGGTNRIFNGSGVQIGGDITTTPECRHLIDATISGTVNLIGLFQYTGGGASEMWFFPEGGAWTQVTDGDFPGTTAIGAPVELDGYIFIMADTGRIYNSDLNSISSWTASSFITCGNSSDGGVGLARYRDFIVGFNTGTTEFFQNAGNPSGSPLKRVATSGFGAIKAAEGSDSNTTIFQFGGEVFFLGVDEQSGVIGVFRLDGQSRKKLSTPSVDALMSSLSVIVGVFRAHGMNHLLIRNNANDTYWAMCLDTGFWWRYVGYTISQIGFNPAAVGTRFTSDLSATLYSLPSVTDLWQDSGSQYLMIIQTENIDAGTANKKHWKYLKLIGDKQSAAASVLVEYSDDDSTSFRTAGYLDMSVENDAVWRLGKSRRRSWKFTNGSNTPCVIKEVEIGYEVEAS